MAAAFFILRFKKKQEKEERERREAERKQELLSTGMNPLRADAVIKAEQKMAENS